MIMQTPILPPKPYLKDTCVPEIQDELVSIIGDERSHHLSRRALYRVVMGVWGFRIFVLLVWGFGCLGFRVFAFRGFRVCAF